MESIEGVVLAGGASRRMGQDKARMLLDGESAALTLARRLAEVCSPVALLGINLLGEFRCVPDPEPGAGPLAALAEFEPTQPLVFVLSCDVPRFDPRLVSALTDRLGNARAVLPVVEGKLQPLCGLYRVAALGHFKEVWSEGKRSMREGLWDLWIRDVDMEAEGLDARWAMSANDPETWARLTSEA